VDPSKLNLTANQKADLKRDIESWGRTLNPVILPPYFADIARQVGADPKLWIESKPLPLTKADV
jgi:hypothetical protein